MNTIGIRLNEPEILKTYGRSALEYLKKMNYWVSKAENSKKPIGLFKDGRRWFYNTVDEWANQIGYSPRQTQRSITALVKDSLILVEKHKRHRRPSINSYALNFQKLQEIGLAKFSLPNCSSVLTTKKLKSTSPEFLEGEGTPISGTKQKNESKLNTTVQDMMAIWNAKFPNNLAVLNLNNGRFLNSAYKNSFDHQLEKWETYCNSLAYNHPQGISIEAALQFKMINLYKNTPKKMNKDFIQTQKEHRQAGQIVMEQELCNPQPALEIDLSKAQEMLDIWNRIFEKKSTYAMTPDREILLAQAFKENFNSNLEEWRCHCLSIQSSSYIMGPKFNKLHLSWAVKKEAIDRIKAKELGVTKIFVPEINTTAIVEAHIAKKALNEDQFLTQVRRKFIELYGELSYKAWIMQVDLKIEDRQLIIVHEYPFMIDTIKNDFEAIFNFVSQYAPNYFSEDESDYVYEYTLNEKDFNNNDQGKITYDSDDKYDPEYEYNATYGDGHNINQTLPIKDEKREETSELSCNQISEIKKKSLNDILLNQQINVIKSYSKPFQNEEEDIGHFTSKDVREGRGSYRHDVTPHITLIHNQHNNNQIKTLAQTIVQSNFTPPSNESNQQVTNYYLKNLYWKKRIQSETSEIKHTLRILGLGKIKHYFDRKYSHQLSNDRLLRRKNHLNRAIRAAKNFVISQKKQMIICDGKYLKSYKNILWQMFCGEQNIKSALMSTLPNNFSYLYLDLVWTVSVRASSIIKRAWGLDIFQLNRRMFFKMSQDSPKRRGDSLQKWTQQRTTLILHDIPNLANAIKIVCTRYNQTFRSVEINVNLSKILRNSRVFTEGNVMRSALFFLGIIGGLGIAATDIFIPILPKLSELYNVTPYLMSYTVSAYFVSCVLGSLCFIYFSKIFSHRRINLLSLLFFIMGSLIITITEIYSFIILGRIIQGFSFGVANTNIITIIKKRKSEDFATSMSSYCIAAEFCCFFAPVTGVLLSEHLSWRAPFLFISVVSCLLLIKSSHIIKSFDLSDVERKNQNHNINYSKTFWLHNFISFIMIGLGWSTISISPYLLEIDSGSALDHGVFYTIYTLFYIAGSYLFERGYINKNKMNEKIIPILCFFSLSLIYTVFYDEKLIFIVGVLLFGGISGAMYGYILEGALRDIPEDQINTATSVAITSRQIASATFIALSSFLYSISESYSLIFCASMGVIVVFLILISSTHQNKNQKEVVYELN